MVQSFVRSVIRFVWYDVICRPSLELKVKVPYQLVLVNVIDNQFPFKDSKNFSSVGSISPPRVLCSVMPRASRLPPTPQDHLYSLHKNIKGVVLALFLGSTTNLSIS